MITTSDLPKRFRCVTTNMDRAKELLLRKRIVVVPYSMWQDLNKYVGKPICLRGTYNVAVYGRVVVLHRYPPKV